jgi:hypothetical protein
LAAASSNDAARRKKSRISSLEELPVLLNFFKHGSNGLLALAIVVILVGSLLGGPHLSPLGIVVGALLFYLSE